MSQSLGVRPGFGTPPLSRSVVDRASARRPDERWLAAAWADPSSRVLLLDEGQATVVDTEAGPSLVLVAAGDAPEGERLFLGTEGGTAYWAVAGSGLVAHAELGPGVRRAGLRDVGALLDDRHAGLLVHAVALANWHATHRHCPRCGAPTRATHGGHLRECTSDGSPHFPRTDPAVIMLVHDGADRAILGRQAAWPPHRYSTLAGFVEPGESAEQAVAREVAEEVGLSVVDVRYAASQPWPFPSSLMLGYTARAVGTALTVDGAEIAEARWFARAELVDAVAAGELLLPPPVSVARRLLAEWLGQDLPADPNE